MVCCLPRGENHGTEIISIISAIFRQQVTPISGLGILHVPLCRSQEFESDPFDPRKTCTSG